MNVQMTTCFEIQIAYHPFETHPFVSYCCTDIFDFPLSISVNYLTVSLITNLRIVENAFQAAVYFDLVFQIWNTGPIVFRYDKADFSKNIVHFFVEMEIR